MARLTNLIKEALSTKPKKKDCNCGCNTCENVGNEGVLLNESVAPKQILSENLQYHVHNKLPLTENTFRYGSQSFINLWAEARSLYLREIIHVNDDDKEILTETDLGNYGMYEGKKVPLDMPLNEESVNEAAFKYDSGDYEEVETLFTKITGRPATDLDNNMFARSGGSADGDGEGWMLNIDDTNIPTNDKTKFVDAVMDLGKQRGWKIKQYGDDAVEIYEKESVNESEDLDKIRKEVEKTAQNSPGKGWTKKSIDQEVNRRFQQFLNRKPMNEEEGVPHYTKDNKEWKGKVHKMPDGSLMSGNPHDKDGSGPNGKSEKLFHKEDLNEIEDNGSEEKEFDAELMAAANGIAATLGKELKAKQGDKEQLDEAVITSIIAAVLTGNALIGFISKMSKKLAKKLNWKKGEDFAGKINKWAHDNEKAFQTPIKRVLKFFIKDEAKLEATTQSIYAIIIVSMAAGYGLDAVNSLNKASWFKASIASLKGIAKSDEAIATAYPVIKSFIA